MMHLIAYALAETAHAAGPVSSTANYVGQGLLAFFGAGDSPFISLSLFIVDRVWSVVAFVAVMVIVMVGFRLLISNDEGKLESSKKIITGTLIGVMMVFLSKQLFNGFYYAGGLGGVSQTPATGVAVIAAEIAGVIDWALVLVAALGVLILVLSGLKVLASFGKEDAPQKVRQAIFGVATGVILIILRPAFVAMFQLNTVCTFDPYNPGSCPLVTPDLLIVAVANIILSLLGFLALVAVAIVIYAGVMLIASFGKDEALTQYRGLVVRSVVGLIIILTAYILTKFVVSFMA